MARVCILTDSTAQFTRPDFSGQDRIYLIPFRVSPDPRQAEPSLSRTASAPQLTAPSEHDFLRFYSQLSCEYDSIMTITLSGSLSPVCRHAQAAARRYNNHTAIQVIDSQTTAVGLGLLVQAAAEAASAGASLTEIECQVRSALTRIYMLVCIPEMRVLAEAGYLSRSQATVGEMLGLLPIFVIEDGRLMPMEKVRTQRHLFESFQEFVDEFEDPYYVALVRGLNHNTIRTRPLREYIYENFPETLFSEHNMNTHLTALLGQQSIGLVVVETSLER
ncbi:MAG: DegV family EDD domain-containing protein [Anaerolineales bacterium]|nr:DegV family EDD domain-containing protein [Anaerolineales bacterium]